MQLVHFLAAGVNGAANGTATFLLRGTASSAASVLYNDFEGTAQPGTNIITLDSNGAAEVYTNAYCDVVIKNSGGSTLRTVTVGSAATNVEVISDSFTGTPYAGGGSAASQPTTLASVLDLWNNSAGTTNWKVLIDGVATNLSSAFAGLSGFFTSVKSTTYGAVGDGVTDDTSAINSAIAATNGGIVFFPAGTYVISSSININVASVTLLGTGPGTIITCSSANPVINIQDNTATGWKTIDSLTLKHSSSQAAGLVLFEQSQNIIIRNCNLDGTNSTDDIVERTVASGGDSEVIIANCRITASSGSALKHAVTADDECLFNVSNCSFIVPSGYTGTIVDAPNIKISGCVFDASAVTSGSYTHIDAVSNSTSGRYLGSVTGCIFKDGGSDGKAFKLTGVSTNCEFAESGNTFVGFTAAADPTESGNIYNISVGASHFNSNIVLGSREARNIKFDNTLGNFILGCTDSYGVIVINHTAAVNLTITLSANISGMKTSLVVLNNSGSAVNISLLPVGVGTTITQSSVPSGFGVHAFLNTAVSSAGTEINMIHSFVTIT